MTEKENEAEVKLKVAKRSAAAKAASPKKEVKAVAAKSGKTVTVKQVRSPIGRQGYQRSTLIGLGLNKMNRTRTLEDSPSVRGMIENVKHLVTIVE